MVKKGLGVYSRLGRTTEHRLAMMRNMVQSLIEHERIVTTVPKAKALRKPAEQVHRRISYVCFILRTMCAGEAAWKKRRCGGTTWFELKLITTPGRLPEAEMSPTHPVERATRNNSASPVLAPPQPD